MKVVILAGGLGTRISEESSVRPKPMVEIGGKPILWHIMKIYSKFGYNDFVICLGYKGDMIKEYFANYFRYNSNLTVDLQKNKIEIHDSVCEPWKITLVDTGDNTMTGGRIKRAERFIDGEEFMLTYGDGVADVNIDQLVDFHHRHGRKATLTSVMPPERFGIINFGDDGSVLNFMEKPQNGGSWINAGFFVLNKDVIDYIDGDGCIWERSPLERLAQERQLMGYKHHGYWQAMDTLRDKNLLNDTWNKGNAPWKMW
ncbi:MAG: glucose-1-phosphate cytidylyltransferase [Methanomassiliicoccales archaeon]